MNSGSWFLVALRAFARGDYDRSLEGDRQRGNRLVGRVSADVNDRVIGADEVGPDDERRVAVAADEHVEHLDTIAALNDNRAVHGIIVQLPLPRTLDAQRILQSIAIGKDVDGFNWANLGAIVDGHPQLAPCTPLGVINMLDRSKIGIEGAHAVVIWRSSIVGKPLALMLIARGATVTVCNSKTPDLATFTRTADILVAAAGRPRLVTAAMVKAGAAVIDVGACPFSDQAMSARKMSVLVTRYAIW